ncbi:MAG: DUF2934 domain-containing protein [Rhodocyclales bacterium]|nr:DUF2934 domain-containing protein [Rhodocyclales bacterium]
MSSPFPIYEGDYCFSLPASISGQPHKFEEKKMKTRSEPVSKTKGNGSGRQPSAANMSAPSSSAGYDCPREQMIAEAAYFRAEQRGFVPGNEMSDWLQAEADVEALAGARD